MKDDRSILQYQLIQHDVGRFELRLATLDEDAFRAANYEAEDVKMLAQAFKTRIGELDAATKPSETTTTAAEPE